MPTPTLLLFGFEFGSGFVRTRVVFVDSLSGVCALFDIHTHTHTCSALSYL